VAFLPRNTDLRELSEFACAAGRVVVSDDQVAAGGSVGDSSSGAAEAATGPAEAAEAAAEAPPTMRVEANLLNGRLKGITVLWLS
jgi:hypothetical protein